MKNETGYKRGFKNANDGIKLSVYFHPSLHCSAIFHLLQLSIFCVTKTSTHGRAIIVYLTVHLDERFLATQPVTPVNVERSLLSKDCILTG